MIIEGIGSGLIFDLGVIVVFATILAFLGRIIKQPPLIMYIIAGLIIGPIGLNLISDVSIPFISELGIAFLLFAIGIQTDFSKLKNFGAFILFGSIVQVAATAGFAFVAARLIGMEFVASIYLGLILAFSSTAIVVKILSDKKEISTLHGKILIGILLVQDFLVVMLLPLLENFSSIINPINLFTVLFSGAFLFLLALFLAKFVFPKFFAIMRASEELLFLSALSVCFLFIFASLFFGFSIAIGGFLAGLSLSSLIYNIQLASKISALRDFFATVFFVSLGLQINFVFSAMNNSFVFELVALMLVTVFLIKPLTMFVLGLLHGYGGRNSFIIAVSLAQISEFSFILAAQGLAAGVFPLDTFSLIVLVTAFSMALTPYLMQASNAFYLFFKKIFKVSFQNSKFSYRINDLEKVNKSMRGHIIVFGAGVIGSNIINSLKSKYAVLAVDNNPEVVFSHKANGTAIVLGDENNSELFEKINLQHARMIVCSFPFNERSHFLVKKAKELNSNVVVFARARQHEETLSLYEAGADFVIMPEIIAGNEFVRNIFAYLETGKTLDLGNLKTTYYNYLKQFEAEEEKRKKFEF
ncbi:MAG: cation:proton antiporter [archaeon]|nr:cation:proton antiporter [archaeon]